MIFAISKNDMDGIGNLACDGTMDLNDLPAYAVAHNLKPGSQCMCIDTATVYMMKSDKTWKAI